VTFRFTLNTLIIVLFSLLGKRGVTVDTRQNVEENPPNQDQRVEENTEEVAQEVSEDQDTQEVA